MSIGISDEHAELASSLRKWAADLRGRELARAAEEDADATFATAWDALTDMGVPAIGLPESAGGGGGTTLDVAVALEACAHELVPGPLLGPVVAATLLGGLAGRGARRPGARRPRRHRLGRARGHPRPGRGRGRLAAAAARGSAPRARARPRPEPPLRPPRGARPVRRRAGGPHDRPGPAYRRHPGRRRGVRDRPVVPGDRRGVRPGARAVRTEDRQLPGGQAPVRRDARDRRGRHRGRLGRGRGGGSGRGAVGVRRRCRVRGLLRRRRRRGQVLHPGARRDRVHLRARRAPLPAPRARPAGARRGRRRRGRAAHRRRGRGRTPARGARPRGPGRADPRRRSAAPSSGSRHVRRRSAARRSSRPAT